MKLGIIARSENRGLGLQSWEVCRHLNPDRVLLVEPQPVKWPQHHDRYKQWDTTVVRWDGRSLNKYDVRQWLDGLDVVYTAETPYSWRIPQWAHNAGCRVVVHANPEQLDRPSSQVEHITWWAPTPWRLEHLPAGTRVVPMPVAADRFPQREPADGPVTFVHSAGHEAQHDRNGTRLVAAVARDLAEQCRLVIYGQDGNLPRVRLHGGQTNVDVELHPGGVENYWDQYQGGDVLVMPRRYGGLCLPAQEALAAGMAVVMTDCSPNEIWPGPRLPVSDVCPMRARCGQVDVHSADQDTLRATMDRLARDGDLLCRLKREARVWAAEHSWEALLAVWRAELERACEQRS